MPDVFTRSLDRFFGRGDASVAIPPMDGALKPNNAIDAAPLLAAVERPDNLVAATGSVLFSSSRKLIRIADDGSAREVLLECDGDILALAIRHDGVLAIFDEAQGLSLLKLSDNGLTRQPMGRVPVASITAAAFTRSGDLLVCIGSSKNPTSEWQRDLLESEAAGSVWLVSLRDGEAIEIAKGLAYPSGCMIVGDGGKALVSESWRHRLILIDLAGGQGPITVLGALPGYPARLSPRSRGGSWLTFFAPRNQLVEFVRREPRYRREMMTEVAKEFWVAPTLASGASFREPMQGGALKQMGTLKPWAPTRSYGLVVALDKEHSPVASYHSRAGGRRHGLTSAVEIGGRLIVASKGGDQLLSLEIEDRE